MVFEPVQYQYSALFVIMNNESSPKMKKVHCLYFELTPPPPLSKLNMIVVDKVGGGPCDFSDILRKRNKSKKEVNNYNKMHTTVLFFGMNIRKH